MSNRNQAAADLLKVAINITLQTQHDVFVDHSAHIRMIQITVHVGGWKGKLENARSVIISVLEADADQQLERARRDLTNIAAVGAVDPETTFLRWT